MVTFKNQKINLIKLVLHLFSWPASMIWYTTCNKLSYYLLKYNSCQTTGGLVWLDCQYIDYLNGSVSMWSGQQIVLQICDVTDGALDPKMHIWYVSYVAVCVQQRIQVNLIQKQDLCMSSRPAVCLPHCQRSALRSWQEQWVSVEFSCFFCLFFSSTVCSP